MPTRIKEKYLAEAVPALQQKFGYKNVMEIPRLEKVIINMGLGDCKDNAKALEKKNYKFEKIKQIGRTEAILVDENQNINAVADGRGDDSVGVE